MIRTFIGVRVAPTAALRGLLERLSAWPGALRPVAGENLHVTLRFLGEVEESLVPALAEATGRACIARRACRGELHGLGAFPSIRRPQTLWVGLRGAEALAETCDALTPALAPLLPTLREERRPWRAHVSVGRVKAKPPAPLSELLRRAQDEEYGFADLSRVELIRSDLTPAGPRYTTLATAALAT